MAALTRDAILKSDDLPRELVPCPEWGGEVWVRTLTGAERDQYEAGLVRVRGKARELNLSNARARLVALAACDLEGNALFTAGDVEALGKKSGKPLDRLCGVAQRLSGLSDADLEEMAGN